MINKIEITDFSLLRKFNYLTIFLIPLLFFILFVYTGAISGVSVSASLSTDWEVKMIVINFFIILLLIIIYLLILFITGKKGNILILNGFNYFYNKNTFNLNHLCLNINSAYFQFELKGKSKEEIIEIVLDNYKNIPTFGNYLVDKKLKKKYEFKIKNKEQLKYLLNELELCLSKRPEWDLSILLLLKFFFDRL